jgi:anti-sigma factor RsiW
MKACAKLLPELVAYVHRQLPEDEIGKVALHLRDCAGCQAEVRRLEKLDALLVEHLPSVELSASFMSTFANRLAAEIGAEQAEEEAQADKGFLAWLWRPWLVPVALVAATAGFVLFMTLPRMGPGSGPAVARHVDRPGAAPVIAEGPKKEEPRAVAEAPRKLRGEQGNELVMASPPKDLLERPGLFLDYPVISDLDTLDQADQTGSGSAG